MPVQFSVCWFSPSFGPYESQHRSLTRPSFFFDVKLPVGGWTLSKEGVLTIENIVAKSSAIWHAKAVRDMMHDGGISNLLCLVHFCGFVINPFIPVVVAMQIERSHSFVLTTDRVGHSFSTCMHLLHPHLTLLFLFACLGPVHAVLGHFFKFSKVCPSSLLLSLLFFLFSLVVVLVSSWALRAWAFLKKHSSIFHPFLVWTLF